MSPDAPGIGGSDRSALCLMVFGIMEVRATSTMNSQHPAGSEFPSGLPSLSQQAQDRPSGQPLFPAADRQLLQDCLQGRPAAWEAFFERFVGLLAFVVDRTAVQRRIVLDRADRDDLLADILLEILHHDAVVLRGFAGRSSLATYLAVVARRVAVRGLVRLAEKKKGQLTLADGHEATHGDNGQARLADREQVEVMLRGLDEVEARLVRLHHLESRSYGEISRLTGMPLGSIGPALARARQKMKVQAE